MTTTPLRIAALTAIAMCAFAANSLLCRHALGDARIDPASFTAIRLAAGALVLALLARSWRNTGWHARALWNALALFGYAICFSYAYLQLSAGTGALLLFASVQFTMVGWALLRGQRPRALQWVGLGVAMAGLLALLLPGIHAPAPLPAVLMAAAGVAWGIYTLRGRGSTQPLLGTARNFVYTLPLVAILLLLRARGLHADTSGIADAILSGALASGCGYAIWYAALGGLSATKAAVAQLTVPALAALGGIALLGESWSTRLLLSTTLILGGVALAVLTRERSGAIKAKERS